MKPAVAAAAHGMKEESPARWGAGVTPAPSEKTRQG
jgi:hypothetical protein